jgi:hypothetical protein
MTIHTRNIALTVVSASPPMGHWLEDNATWRFTEWSLASGGEPSDMDGNPNGEFAGANESTALKSAHA